MPDDPVYPFDDERSNFAIRAWFHRRAGAGGGA